MSEYPEEPLLDNNSSNPYYLSPLAGRSEPANPLSTVAPAPQAQYHQTDHNGSHPALRRLLTRSGEIQANIDRIRMVLPGVTIYSAHGALLKCQGNLDDALNLLASTRMDVEIAPSIAPAIAFPPSTRAAPSIAPPPAANQPIYRNGSTRVTKEQMMALKQEFATYPRNSNDVLRRRHREATARKVGVIPYIVGVKFGEFIRMEKRALQKAANRGPAATFANGAPNQLPVQGFYVNTITSRKTSHRKR